MPAFIMGGMALVSGVMGAMGQSTQAKASAAAQKIQQQQQNFKQQWAHEAEQRNVMRQFQANLERNALIERGANIDRAMAEVYLDKDFQNAKSTLSKQTATTNDQFIGTMASRGVSRTSGTARALLRQNMSAMEANMIALRQNHETAYKDIVNQQNQKLSQRQFSFQEQSVFLPTTGGIADASASALTTGLIQAGLAAGSAYMMADLEYGKPGTPPKTTLASSTVGTYGAGGNYSTTSAFKGFPQFTTS